MSPLASGGTGSTRATRTNAPGTRAKDDHDKAADTAVMDAATATEFLIDGDFQSDDDEITLDFLSAVAMQLSQQPKTQREQQKLSQMPSPTQSAWPQKE